METSNYSIPQSLLATLSGASPVPGGFMRDKMRRVLITYPSAYQLLPTYPCVHDARGRPVDPFQDDSWLPRQYRPLLQDGKAFRTELGDGSTVPTV